MIILIWETLPHNSTLGKATGLSGPSVLCVGTKHRK